jgi:hypothetical protein
VLCCSTCDPLLLLVPPVPNSGCVESLSFESLLPALGLVWHSPGPFEKAMQRCTVSRRICFKKLYTLQFALASSTVKTQTLDRSSLMKRAGMRLKAARHCLAPKGLQGGGVQVLTLIMEKIELQCEA